MYHFLRVLVLLSIVKSSFCQDQTNFTQFFLNPFLINPSYAGIDGKTTLSVHYRNQWTSIEGAPRIGNFSLHTPLNPKLSFGTSVTNDSRGVFNTSGLQLTIAYNIAISDDAFIRFGISGGGAWNMVDLKKLDGFNDPALANILDNNASITGNAGLSFHAKTFHFGASLPTLLSPSLVSTDAFTVTEVKPFEAILVHASNRFYFNKNKNVFEPYAIYRMNTGLPSQFEVAGILHLNHAIWLGSSYKQDFGISALGGVKLKNMFAIGASYGLQNAGINELNSPTVEITLGYLLGKHKKDTPLYSFINTVKEKKKVHHHQSASEAIAQKHKEDELARKKHQEELAKQRQQELAEQKRQQEELARKQREEALARKQQEEERKKQQALAAQQKTEQPSHIEKETLTGAAIRTDTVKVVHRARFNQIDTQLETINIQVTEHSHHDEQERISRLSLHAEDPDEHHEHDVTHHPNAERHEFVKRGTHKDEMDIADYVIAGVFKSRENARHFADGIDKMGFQADFGHLTEKGLWYVYIYESQNIEEARAERDRFRKMKMFRDAWLLTVHH